jgi:hypothetical protein
MLTQTLPRPTTHHCSGLNLAPCQVDGAPRIAVALHGGKVRVMDGDSLTDMMDLEAAKDPIRGPPSLEKIYVYYEASGPRLVTGDRQGGIKVSVEVI